MPEDNADDFAEDFYFEWPFEDATEIAVLVLAANEAIRNLSDKFEEEFGAAVDQQSPIGTLRRLAYHCGVTSHFLTYLDYLRDEVKDELK